VAVLVPEGHPAAGASAALPLVGRDVPVLEDAGTSEPSLLVPAHDGLQLEQARALGLTPVLVLDGEGVVEAEGPMKGLSRYAARAAATKLLEDEGVVTGTESRQESILRCRRCGSVLVPRLGRHWFLALAELELAAADAVRDAPVTFSTQTARDELLERAGAGGEWCLSHQVWAGQPVPVARCLDCGQVAVILDDDLSCGKCMGMLEPDDSVLDARFVGTVAMVAAAGWPDDERAAATVAPVTTLVVGPSGVSRWALPLAALGVRLAGTTVFEHLAAHGAPDGEMAPGEVDELIAQHGPVVVRLALLAGGLDMEAARGLAQMIEAPPQGEGTIDDLWPAFEAAFDAGLPGHAVSVLASVLSAGIRPADAAQVRALAAPLLGRSA
jgi:valyl-tRNA synthetase